MSLVKFSSSSLYGSAIVILGVSIANSAWAATLGDTIGLVSDNHGITRSLITLPTTISIAAYALGAVAIIMAGVKLKAYSDHPNQTPLMAGIIRLITGGALLGLPQFAKTIINTLAANGALSQAKMEHLGFIVAAPGTNIGLDEMLSNFMGNIQGPLLGLISLVTYILGAWLILKGLLKSARYADDGPKGQSGMGILSHLMVGGALMALPGFLSEISHTLGLHGSVTFNSLRFDNTAGLDDAAKAKINNAARAVFAFVQIVGVIGFVRGVNMLRTIGDGASQNASMPAAITHIIGGAIAWNIVAFVNVISATLGIQNLAA